MRFTTKKEKDELACCRKEFCNFKLQCWGRQHVSGGVDFIDGIDDQPDYDLDDSSKEFSAYEDVFLAAPGIVWEIKRDKYVIASIYSVKSGSIYATLFKKQKAKKMLNEGRRLKATDLCKILLIDLFAHCRQVDHHLRRLVEASTKAFKEDYAKRPTALDDILEIKTAKRATMDNAIKTREAYLMQQAEEKRMVAAERRKEKAARLTADRKAKALIISLRKAKDAANKRASRAAAKMKRKAAALDKENKTRVVRDQRKRRALEEKVKKLQDDQDELLKKLDARKDMMDKDAVITELKDAVKTLTKKYTSPPLPTAPPVQPPVQQPVQQPVTIAPAVKYFTPPTVVPALPQTPLSVTPYDPLLGGPSPPYFQRLPTSRTLCFPSPGTTPVTTLFPGWSHRFV